MSKHLIQSKIFLTFLGVAMTLNACNGMSSNHPEPTATATTYSSKPETTQSEERSPASQPSQPSQTPRQDNSEAESTATTATSSSQPETTSPKRQTFASQPSQKLASKSSTTATQVQLENYKAISLDTIADADALVGNDPKSLALSAFGNIDSEGGSRNVTVDYPQSQRAIVTITQTGVADDSVGGIKHRVELQQTKSAQSDPQWKVVWAGSQVKCHPGRGHQDWSTELCF